MFLLAFPQCVAIDIPPIGVRLGAVFWERQGILDKRRSSLEHFMLLRNSDGELQIVDLGSTNGTSVNRIRLLANEPCVLEDGDVVRVGGVVFVYRTHFFGPMTPDPPMCGVISPFGTRRFKRDLLRLVAEGVTNVYLAGDMGTGKSLVGAAIAEAFGRGHLYIIVNAATLVGPLVESQLFGHVKGAFSGADERRPGLLVKHDGGALFFDEFGDLALDVQAKLLVFFETRELLPVGATATTRADVLVIVATNRDLDAMVSAGTFRPDLLARLNAGRLWLPPLRERPEDIWAIFASTAASRGAPYDVALVEAEAVELLLTFPWPENVRQLVKAAVPKMATEQGPPKLSWWAASNVLRDLPGAPPPRVVSTGRPRIIRQVKAPLTLAAAEEALANPGGNILGAARSLGIARSTFRGQLARLRGKG
jgi:DNA-binding NtrC family response regulator